MGQVNGKTFLKLKQALFVQFCGAVWCRILHGGVVLTPGVLKQLELRALYSWIFYGVDCMETSKNLPF